MVKTEASRGLDESQIRRVAETSTWRGGDATAGYLIRVERGWALLRLTCWGYWRNELGFAFRQAMFAALDEIGKLPRWDVLADLSKYPAQKAAVQTCHADAMSHCKQLPGFRRAANLVDNTFSEMQIRRLSQDSGLPAFSFFQDEVSALDWLSEQAADCG